MLRGVTLRRLALDRPRSGVRGAPTRERGHEKEAALVPTLLRPFWGGLRSGVRGVPTRERGSE